jgi:chromosome segregation ATPase
MEEVLREVKQNTFLEEREKEKLRKQAEEAERKVEDHEIRVLELQASLDTLRSDRVKATPSPQKGEGPTTPGVTADIDFAVKDATEKVARELHALYKSKHERKVADLKVSYEKRWIKQVEQLRADLKMSQDEVVKLQTEKEATMSGIIPGQTEAFHKMEGQIEELRRWNDEVSAGKKVAEAEVAGLRSQVDSLSTETDSLRKEIEQERIEKGDLVAQVDLFLSMSAQQEEQRTIQQPQQPVSPPRSEDGNGRPGSSSAVASPNKFRTSLNGTEKAGIPGRPRPLSMLQKPTAGKFSGIPPPGSGLKAPKTNGYGGRLMDGISRMGAGSR